MSEPLSSVEIEDVLSSIRRLVSEDMRPAPRGPAPLRPMTSAGAVGGADKLILTPALRVVEDVPVMGDVVTTLGARVVEVSGEWESETGDPAPMALDAEPDAAWSIPEPEVVSEPERLAEGEGEAAPEAEILFEAEADLSLDEGELAPVIEFVSIREEVLAPAPEAAALEAEVPGWAQAPASGEEEEMSAPDPWQGATIEPDPAWADAAEAEALEELQATPGLEPEAPLGQDDEMRFEEEVLRELVRDILREELQGNLGERITRNIRKLVRAEVALALAARDLS